jgi:hypothetical protein
VFQVHAYGLALSCNETKEAEQLSQLDFISFDSNGDRPPEQFHRYDQALVRALTHEDSFDAVKRSSANAHAPALTDERIWKTRNVLAYRCPETLDLFVRNRSPLSFTSDETQHTWGSQHLQPLFDYLGHADECIATKQGDFHLPPSVTPPVDLVEKGKERAHTFLFKLRSYPLFVPRHSVNCVPVQFIRSAI